MKQELLEMLVNRQSLDAASVLPTSRSTEDDLWRGGIGLMRPRVVEEACDCGGVISAEDHDEDIRAAVAVHNQTARHGQWRARRFAP